ncbi:rhomboid family intramembrane serine protease [Hymenobacter armeniacus]|uniref:Rhomboid family intramembrane serine protease n=1 Tax=Hymenobacter armeniacus TaxID=2771358 RepID=A0ABR8JSS8_9BACT|nr:rhomboid family intramembrane serine protease [Hymenobacter armeniacus]MBD2721833.1 rhomboid family intramembrane serine protease [Hymenobacter armeniacus]
MFNITPTVRNLLIVNVAFLLAQMNLLPLLTQIGSLYPIGSPYFFPWQFFTYMFLHAGWGHLFSNMLGLMVFGPLLEQRWGASRFLTFWLICGVGAGLLYEGVRGYEGYRMEQARQEFHQSPNGPDFDRFFSSYFPEATGYQTLAHALERNPQNQEYIKAATDAVDGAVEETRNSKFGGMLGASGALFGLIFAFAYLFPNTKLFIFPFPFPVAAKYLAFGYTLIELYQGVHRVPGDNVAHFAHLGGLLIGFFVVKYWEGGRERFY